MSYMTIVFAICIFMVILLLGYYICSCQTGLDESLHPVGRLKYGKYANQGQSSRVNQLPDFSYAGYRCGGVALPQLQEKIRLRPKCILDDAPRIQEAIDQVSRLMLDQNGHRGAVVLSAGTYNIKGSLKITAAGVVLRGEGRGLDGTILIATLPQKHDLILLKGKGSGFGEVSGTRMPITDTVVPVGGRSFTARYGDFLVGDTIVIVRTPNKRWVRDLGLHNISKYSRVGDKVKNWAPKSFRIYHERTVTNVNGDRVTVDIPFVDSIEKRYGGGYVCRSQVEGRISEVGVENLRIVSIHDGSDDDEKHAWTAVRLQRVQNGWVRNVTAENFGRSAVCIANESNFNTVEDVYMVNPVSKLIGKRRYSFLVEGGLGNLFNRCFSDKARHSLITTSRVVGPNVWLDCLSTNSYNDDGPHGRWATGLLFDNTKGNELNVQNRLDRGSGHGWAGAQVMFWNTSYDTYINDAPVGSMNWAVGATGKRNEGKMVIEDPNGIEQSPGTTIRPRSLYLQQLEERLGRNAVEAVTTSEQRKGRIWNHLLKEGHSNMKLFDLDTLSCTYK